MRHRKSFNHLGRTSSHRKAMLSNMASSLILHKRIKTTTAKAKALKRYIDPLITRSKDDTTHSRRVVFSHLEDKEAVAELFREIGPKVADRPGGYTRIIRLGARLGDSAEICMIELVDFNENLLAEKASEKKSSRRRRGGKKKTTETVAAAGGQEVVAEKDDVAETDVVTEAEPETAESEDEEPVAEVEKSEEEASDIQTAESSAAEIPETEAEVIEDISAQKSTGEVDSPEQEKEDSEEEESEKKDSK